MNIIYERIKFLTLFIPDIKSGKKTQTRRLDDPTKKTLNHGQLYSVIEVSPDGKHEKLTTMVIKITSIKYQKVQHLSCADYVGEGFRINDLSMRDQWRIIWDEIYGKDKKRIPGKISRLANPWSNDPWCIAYTFEVVK